MILSADQIHFLDAADQGDVEAVGRMLAAGVEVNTLDDRRLPRNRTALMHAARNGHLDVVEALLEAGAKVDLKDRGFGVALPGGNTALLLAMRNKHVRVARTLLQAGADPKVKSGDMTVFGQAAYLGDVQLVRLLLKMGLDPDQAISKRADLPLASALFAKQTEVVRVLLSAGTNPNRPGRAGVRPLDIAIKAGLLEAVQLLLHHGADPNAVSAKGFTPLMTAVLARQKGIVKILLQRYADLNARNRRGQTALDLAQQQLNRQVNEDFTLQLERQGLDVSEYLKAYQEIVTLLLLAGAKTGDQLPPDPRARSKPLPTKRGRLAKPPSPKVHARSGVKDFLEMVRYTEPEFSVMAVKAPAGKTAAAFAGFRNPRKWLENVPRQAAAGVRQVKASLTTVVKVKRNPWTLIFRSLFRLGKDDYQSIAEEAMELSSRLKTKTIAFVRDETAKALGYHFYEKGRLSEQAQWIEDSSVVWFKSRFRRQPQKEESGEDFIDKVFRQQGIYLPACYPQYKRKNAWLAVEKVSARSIQHADIMILPRRKQRGRKD
jgi:ankyrin repeat protein